ncbi:MAG TPA: YkgJ family cysteine cluster protein [Candidatus Saccharimonadales bacterium]|nr:YkgJ family cysteine cluster protein [Candidatus Saccharimonadales bacterium]
MSARPSSRAGPSDAATAKPVAASNPPSPARVTARLCLTCGLCCDGTLFKDVELQPGDAPADLEARGLPLRRVHGKTKFPQPCAALNGCRCEIYRARPSHCRQFECLLFQSVSQGRTAIEDALRIIRDARGRAARVRRLLRELGDEAEQVALSVRFRRLRRRFEQGLGEPDQVERFGELTLAVHELNLALSGAFYS